MHHSRLRSSHIWDVQQYYGTMPQKGFRSLLVRDDVYYKVKSFYRDKAKSGKLPKKKSFSRFVNDLVEEVVENDAIFSSANLVLKKLAVEGNSIMIRDAHLDRLVEVRVQVSRNGQRELTCMFDKKKDCAHVGFAYSIPELYRMT